MCRFPVDAVLPAAVFDLCIDSFCVRLHTEKSAISAPRDLHLLRAKL
jgi:hypothetical protein